MYLTLNNLIIPIKEFSRNFSTSDADFVNVQIQLEHDPSHQVDFFNEIIKNKNYDFTVSLDDNSVINFDNYTFERIYESFRDNEKEFTLFFKWALNTTFNAAED